MKKTRIEYPTGKVVSFEDLPTPEFRVGDFVHYVNDWGEIISKNIIGIEYEVKFCDNNHISFIEYEFYYEILSKEFHYNDGMAKEERVYSDIGDAMIVSNSIKKELKAKNIKHIKECIEIKTTELYNLMAKLKQQE